MGIDTSKLLRRIRAEEKEQITKEYRDFLVKQTIQVKEDTSKLKDLVRYITPDLVLSTGETVLSYAVKKSNTEAVSVILEHGADANLADVTGSPPLHTAVIAENDDAIDLLFKYGARSDMTDTSGMNALHLACIKGSASTTKRLLKNGVDSDVKSKSSDKTFPLILAAANGHPDCVEALLTEGASTDSKDVWGFTAVSKATSNKQKECVDLLVKGGADINMPNKIGASPLQYAVIRNHCDLVLCLIRAGANVNKFSSDLPPLMVAALNSCDRCLKVLLDTGYKIDTKDKQNRTALYAALCDRGNIEQYYQNYKLVRDVNRFQCAEMLIQNGANLENVWKSHFWNTRTCTKEQLALYRLAIRSCGFKDIRMTSLQNLFQKLYSAGCFATMKTLVGAGYKIVKTPEEMGSYGKLLSRELCTCEECETCKEDTFMGDSESVVQYILHWITVQHRTPQSLASCCRKVIRRKMSWNVSYLIKRLPLAYDVKDFIIHCELD